MKQPVWLMLLMISLFVMFIVGMFSSAAYAQAQQDDLTDITEEKIQLVRANCVSAQVSIQRLQNSDVVTRTNRGRSYENILKLMAALNARVASNKLTEPKLIETTGLMQRQVTQFYKHYDNYKDTIEKMTQLDCEEQPVSFYRDLQNLRQQREVLKADAAVIDKHVTDYGLLVADLKNRMEKPAEGQNP